MKCQESEGPYSAALMKNSQVQRNSAVQKLVIAIPANHIEPKFRSAVVIIVLPIPFKSTSQFNLVIYSSMSVTAPNEMISHLSQTALTIQRIRTNPHQPTKFIRNSRTRL